MDALGHRRENEIVSTLFIVTNFQSIARKEPNYSECGSCNAEQIFLEVRDGHFDLKKDARDKRGGDVIGVMFPRLWLRRSVARTPGACTASFKDWYRECRTERNRRSGSILASIHREPPNRNGSVLK